MVSLEDINRITEETNIKKTQVDKVFKYIKNPAKGNDTCVISNIIKINLNNIGNEG